MFVIRREEVKKSDSKLTVIVAETSIAIAITTLANTAWQLIYSIRKNLTAELLKDISQDTLWKVVSLQCLGILTLVIALWLLLGKLKNRTIRKYGILWNRHLGPICPYCQSGLGLIWQKGRNHFYSTCRRCGEVNIRAPFETVADLDEAIRKEF